MLEDDKEIHTEREEMEAESRQSFATRTKMVSGSSKRARFENARISEFNEGTFNNR